MTVQDGKDESGFRAQTPQVLEETTNPFSVMVEQHHILGTRSQSGGGMRDRNKMVIVEYELETSRCDDISTSLFIFLHLHHC